MKEGARIVSMYDSWFAAFGGERMPLPIRLGEKFTISRVARVAGAKFFALEEFSDDDVLFLASGFREDQTVN